MVRNPDVTIISLLFIWITVFNVWETFRREKKPTPGMAGRLVFARRRSR
jgi:hypothetical protein